MTKFFGCQGSFLAHLDNKDYWRSHLSQWFYLTKITGKVGTELPLCYFVASPNLDSIKAI